LKERKLTKTQFKEAFKRGLGNPFIELKESNNREKYKDIVLWTCLRNTCYDMQCEGGRGSDTVDMDWFYSNSKNKFGDKRVDTYLQNNAIKSEYINAFLKSISHSEIQNRREVNPPTLEELIKTAREQRSRSRGLALRFAKVATEDDLIELAKYAVEETNLEIKLEILWTFRKVRFPMNEQIIFELAESDNPSIREIAFEMLQHLPSDLIHDFAINLIQQKKELANALSLLCYCYETEDETILFEGIQSLKISYKDGGWHGVFMDVEDLLL
jgi:hypothetical protein